MSTTKPQLHIDTTEARADVDLKSSIEEYAEFAEEGKQAALMELLKELNKAMN